MATEITCTVKEGSGPGARIEAVGGPLWAKDVDTVIGEIEEGREYFVLVGPARIVVVVERRNGSRWLRTDPDATTEDNLCRLPACPR